MLPHALVWVFSFKASSFSLTQSHHHQTTTTTTNQKQQAHLRDMREGMRRRVDLPPVPPAEAAAEVAAEQQQQQQQQQPATAAAPGGAAGPDELDVDDDELLELQAAQMQEMVREKGWRVGGGFFFRALVI